MAKVFNSVLMVPGQPEIAKVNRKTGTLYLSDEIWNRLPAPEKDFVLFHEEGHLKLESADEFTANTYAVGKFMRAGTFNNKEFGNKIMVMRSILSKADQTSSFSDITGAASGILDTVFSGLPILGIGSKSRQKEAAANAQASAVVLDAQSKLEAQKSKKWTTVILIGSVMLLVGLVLFFTLRKK
jgi:hypothetical protein